jgi:hypothetical protein
MAKEYTYIVSFNRAKRTDRGFYQVSFDIGKASVNHEVTAASLDDLDRRVTELAHQFGQTCSPYVRLKDKTQRAPKGFNAWKPNWIIDVGETVA